MKFLDFARVWNPATTAAPAKFAAIPSTRRRVEVMAGILGVLFLVFVFVYPYWMGLGAEPATPNLRQGMSFEQAQAQIGVPPSNSYVAWATLKDGLVSQYKSPFVVKGGVVPPRPQPDAQLVSLCIWSLGGLTVQGQFDAEDRLLFSNIHRHSFTDELRQIRRQLLGY